MLQFHWRKRDLLFLWHLCEPDFGEKGLGQMIADLPKRNAEWSHIRNKN